MTDKLIIAIKGGPGSGFRGHGGRPGKRGGSAPKSTGFQSVSDFKVGGEYRIKIHEGALAGEYDAKCTDIGTDPKCWDADKIRFRAGNHHVVLDLDDFEVVSDKPVSEIPSIEPVSEKLDPNFESIIDGEDSVTVYHSTFKDLSSTIQKEGLRANSTPNHSDVESGVYFTTSMQSAKNYGEGYGMGAGGYVIIEATIPKSEFHKVAFDVYDAKLFGAKDSFVIGRDIPPGWFKKIRRYRETEDYDFVPAGIVDVSSKETKANITTMYMVVILANDEGA